MSVPPIPNDSDAPATEGLNPRAGAGLRKGQGSEGSVHVEHDHHELSFLRKYIFSTDHKVIAMQYLFTGMFMAMIGGFFAYVFRMQLAFPGEAVPL